LISASHDGSRLGEQRAKRAVVYSCAVIDVEATLLVNGSPLVACFALSLITVAAIQKVNGRA
jgi:hypothetical protein